MKVLTYLPRCDLQRRIERALSSAQFVVETVVSAHECLQSPALRSTRVFSLIRILLSLKTQWSWLSTCARKTPMQPSSFLRATWIWRALAFVRSRCG